MAKASLLIVEDEAIVAADLAQKLGRLGYLISGSTGYAEEALELVREKRPDLILMDIRLAGAMDGIEAAEIVRRDFDLPVIFLTAHSDRITLERAKLSEPFGYLLKPFDDLGLETHIEMALYKHRTERKLRQAKLDAEAASRTKSRFLANMSHELRTPMTGLLGMLDLALQSPCDARQKGYLETARSSGAALLGVLNDILDLTRVEAGKLSLEESPFELRACVSGAVQLLIPEARRKGLELKLEIAEQLPRTVVGDPVRLRQVLTNLVGNAVKFTERGEVELLVSGGKALPGAKVELQFQVRDTGAGIPEEKQHLLFDTFSQVDDSNTRCFGGTGLGLAISKGIVALMSGSIGFESREGKGSTFHFAVPLGVARQGEPELARSPEPLPLPPAGSAAARGLRILIAEDDATIREVMGSMLGRVGYAVDFAGDGEQAISMWEAGEYDVILMDVQMPRLDGFEATGAIRDRELARGERTPIIAMTAHAMKGDEKRCLDAGMDAYLCKPIDFKSCLEMIRELAWKGERCP